MLRKIFAYSLVALVILIYFKLSEWQFKKLNERLTERKEEREECIFKAVISGNKILCEIESEEIVIKLSGVDTSKTEKEAKKFLENLLIPGEKLELEREIYLTDEEGNVLAYVFKDGLFINELILKEGLGILDTGKGYLKYIDVLVNAQQEAISKRKGVWKNLQN